MGVPATISNFVATGYDVTFPQTPAQFVFKHQPAWQQTRTLPTLQPLLTAVQQVLPHSLIRIAAYNKTDSYYQKRGT